jgi:hypothetical protein
MKKIYSFMVAAVAMIAAVSCNKEFSNDNLFGGDVITFRASVDGADTKAVLNGTKSSWEANDKITIHNGEEGFEFTATEAGESVNFTYDNTVDKKFCGEKFMAVYPAGKYSADVENKIITASIPTEQGASKSSFKLNNSLAVAFTDNNLLAAGKVEPLEEVIDDLKETLRSNHIRRLQRGLCSIEAGFVWSDLLTGLERVSDHCSNVAICMIDLVDKNMNQHQMLKDVRSNSNEFEHEYRAYSTKYSV